MKLALTDGKGAVVQVVESTARFDVAPPFEWLQASDDVTTAWTVNPNKRLVQPPARSLQVLRDERWEYLRQRRQAALDGGIEWGGYRWDSTPDDMMRIATRALTWRNAMQLPDKLKERLPGPIPESVSWTTEDNREVPLTVDDLTLLDAAMAIHTEIQFGIGKALRAALAAASTAAEIAAIDWP